MGVAAVNPDQPLAAAMATMQSQRRHAYLWRDCNKHGDHRREVEGDEGVGCLPVEFGDGQRWHAGSWRRWEGVPGRIARGRTRIVADVGMEWRDGRRGAVQVGLVLDRCDCWGW